MRFRSSDDLETTLRRYAILYNQHIPQKALKQQTLIDALPDWQERQPGFFTRGIPKLARRQK